MTEPNSVSLRDRRRSSVTGQAIAELFSTRPAANGNPVSGPAYPGAVAAQVQRRRLSLTTIGLSGSSGQNLPLHATPRRSDSMSSTTTFVDESPFDEESTTTPGHSTPLTPFTRRLSFGPRGFRDVKNGEGGFNFADNLRTRAKRASISGPVSSGLQSFQQQPQQQHQQQQQKMKSGTGVSHSDTHHRAQSMAAIDQLAREMPPQPNMPDAFQERILKGDFYMD